MNTAMPDGLLTVRSSFFVFDLHGGAEDAVRRLGRSGFGRDQLSLVGKGYDSDSEQETQGFRTQGARLRAHRGCGACWSGIWGLLSPPAVFVLPGLGLVGMTGPLVETFADALDGTAEGNGLSALAAALTQLGGPPESVCKYENALKLNKYLLLVHGSAPRLGAQPGAQSHGVRQGARSAVWVH